MAKLNNFYLCIANVWHKRFKPSINAFSYSIFYLCFDLAKTKEISSKLLALNRFNLFSFYEKDHGTRDGSNLEHWIRQILSNYNLDHKTKRIFLLTHPRVLGYVFNPVSFWFCLDEQEKLIAVLAEVNNTFGESHNYLIFNYDYSVINSKQWFEAKKDFYVSPFFEVEGSYKFRFIFNSDRAVAWINYFSNSAQNNLFTSVICKHAKFSDFLLLKQFFLIPLVTFKVIFLIYWQAFKIWIKGNRYISKPVQKKYNFTATTYEKL